MPQCCWRNIVDEVVLPRRNAESEESNDFLWLAARARELMKGARRVGLGRGVHGQPQSKAICEAIIGVQKNNVSEPGYKDFTSHMSRLRGLAHEPVQLLRSPVQDWNVASQWANAAEQIATDSDKIADKLAAEEKVQDHARGKAWVHESLDKGPERSIGGPVCLNLGDQLPQ